MSVGSSAAGPEAAARRSLLIAVFSLLGATLFWASNYIVGAAVLETMDPLSLVLWRWTLAAVPLLAIAHFAERPDWREVLRAWPWLLALSCTGLAGYNLTLYAALQYSDAFSASLINAFNPAVIAVAAAIFLRQRLTRTGVAGVVIALVGVFVVVSGGDVGAFLETGFGVGQMLMFGAVGIWTAYTIIGRRSPPLPPITSTSIQAVITVLLVAPVTFATGGPQLPVSADAATSLVLIAVFPSVLSYLLWNRALAVIPAARAGVFLNLITVFTVAFTLLAGQPFTVGQLVGGGVVIVGVVVANAEAFRRPGEPHPRIF
ncbi:DMT family transporter [Pseudoclavibacter sp. RFBB5]|uniref:DMT family transporter n=1 Tax=Pseudoclavibacter sp. RFBB5 TaxID=2080574 RepID=UPI0021572A56|nr:DMT family transporter [Pseudoclavibacter sp. RFBB5]